MWVLAIFDWQWLYTDEFRTVGLVVSVIAVILAALSLTLDFGAIEAGVEAGAPKYMEWYAAYALMVTVVWLYITLLRLLAFLAGPVGLRSSSPPRGTTTLRLRPAARRLT